MDALPEFALVRATTLDDVIRARATHPASSLLGGGTDLVVNIRRGIVAPPVGLAGTAGKGTLAVGRLCIGYARQDQPISETEGDGKYYLSLRPGEFVTAVRARNTPGLHSAYDKIRIRRSIEYPVTGVAVALRREREALADLRVAFTGTNPRPMLLKGTAELCGGALDARVFKGLDALVRDQIMSMKTTFTT